MKTFYSGKFIEKSKLEEAGINYPIKLEYYKRYDEDEQNKFLKYGITIVKTEYKKDKVKIETKDIKYISNDERNIEKILTIFKENEVTPISVEEILEEISKKYFNQNSNFYINQTNLNIAK